MSKTTDSISSTCVLCCQAIKVYAVGQCDHHICFTCSTKMRVLCDQKYCAVCRSDMPRVIFTQKLHPYEGFISHKFPADRKHGIAFANSKLQEQYRRLQDHRCPMCPARRLPENTFKDLQDHMRREHEMFYCELCLKHLQVFTNERKYYNRRNLALHKRKGDPDDTSYRGHPLCEFCEERYFDNDELLKHLRRQHYFCHFCETDGASNQYYNDYTDLKCHFGEEHYLCDDVDCANEEFTHAFRSEIDLKAHKAMVHSKGMSKAQVRQARQLDIEVNLPPRQRDNYRGSGRGRGRRYNDRYDYNDYDPSVNISRAMQASVDSARREEQTREREQIKEREEGAKKAKRMQKAKEKTTGNERRRQNGNGSGKISPVPMEDGANKVTKKTKDDDDKENQRRKEKKETLQSAKPKAANVFNDGAKTEKKELKEFPSLATFKPLSDETVTPSWIEDKTSSVSTASKESKKKKKKKKDSGFTIEEPESGGFAIEEPESGFDLYSGLKNGLMKNVEEKKPVISDIISKPIEQPSKPMWTANGSSNNKSSALPTNVSSTYQNTGSWANNVSSMSQPSWGKNVATAQPIQKQDTWASNVAVSKKSEPVASTAWSSQNSAPNLGNSADFPTLSSIASLLGGTTTKKSKPAKQDNNRNKKQPEKEKKVEKGTKVEKTPKWNEVTKPEIKPKEVVAKNNVVVGRVVGHGTISNGPRPPPGLSMGLSMAPSSNAIKKAPPGFGPIASTPPPGFSSTVPATSTVPGSDYIQPMDYAQRNIALLQKIKDYLNHDDGKLMIFKTVSGDFRRSNISPAEYYQHCVDLLGGGNLAKIFSEMVSLLPDVIKQQELLAAANDYKIFKKEKTKQDKVLKISESKGQSNVKKTGGGKVWGNTADHSTCTQCGQVMLTVDMEAHLNSHQDFPSLSSTVKKKTKPSMAPSSWGRIK